MLRDLTVPRRVLITPGMVELGALQAAENSRVGQIAGGICDRVIVVGPANRAALISGLTAGGLNGERIIIAAGREDGFKKLAELLQPGDCVLVENDLPDVYETRELF